MNDPGPLEALDLVDQIAALLERVQRTAGPYSASGSDALTPADVVMRIADLLRE